MIETPTAEQIAQCCRIWQGRLLLVDWEVDVKIVRRQELKSGVGNATIDMYRRARVRLLDPIDFEADDWPADRDLEVTLVHELMHLLFHDACDPKPDTLEYRAFERAIEATALALVKISRGGS